MGLGANCDFTRFCKGDTQVVRENSDSIVEAVRAVYIEEGNDTPPRGG
jgi:hypothetical protein